MPGANVFAYDGTGYKPTNRSLTAAIASRTASGYTAVSYCYQLSKPAAVTVSTQIWQGFPPAPSQVTFVQGYNGAAAPSSVNRTTISWTCAATTTLNRFELYQKVGTGAFTAVNTNIGAAVRSYVVDGHAAGTTYTYFVKSVANSGLTLSGAENSFTLSAPAITGVSMSIPATTSSSITYRSTFPAGVWQRVVWQYFAYINSAYTWVDVTSATIGSTATTADWTRTGLSERTSHIGRAVLYDYNNFSMASDGDNLTYRTGTTTNQPPNAPSLNGIVTGPAADPVPAVGSNSGFATSGEVLKYIGVNYTLAADTDFLNSEVYLYSGASSPTTFVSSQVSTTAPGAAAAAWFYVSPNTKYWALVRQRDNNGGQTDNATGWQSITTPAVFSYTNANAYDTATGRTYSESAYTFEPEYTDISYLEDSITIASDYSSADPHPIYGGALANTVDRDLFFTNFVSWRVLNNTFTSGGVGRIRFEMSDNRQSFLKYWVNGTTLFFNQKKHNVTVQMRQGSAGAWQGSLYAQTKTGNNDPYIYDTPNNDSFTQNMQWPVAYGVGYAAKFNDAAGAVGVSATGNGGQAFWAMRFGIRNPTTTSPFVVHLAEYSNINITWNKETYVTTYTNTPAVTRYY